MAEIDTNKGAIDNEIKYLLGVMKEKEMRRYKRFLFSYYNGRKLFVSMREFVWTHIRQPFLANVTCDEFKKVLFELDRNTLVELDILDFSKVQLFTPPHTRKITIALCHNFVALGRSDSMFEYKYPENLEDPEAKPGLHRVKNTGYTLGDLCFVTGTVVHIYRK